MSVCACVHAGMHLCMCVYAFMYVCITYLWYWKHYLELCSILPLIFMLLSQALTHYFFNFPTRLLVAMTHSHNYNDFSNLSI